MMSFEVGDKVKMKYDCKYYEGFIIEIGSLINEFSYLCRFPGFKGHNGIGNTTSGKTYDTNDYWFCRGEMLTLLDKNKGENIGMKLESVTNIKTGSKIVSIPQDKAKPLKVECRTVIATIDGKDYEAVCMPGDNFTIEDGLKAIVIKYFFGGASEYEKFIAKLVKFYNDLERNREEEKRVAIKKEKSIARKKARMERRRNAERQARIDEMSEAFYKAMRHFDDVSLNAMVDEDTAIMNVDCDIEKMCEDFLKNKGLAAASVSESTNKTN